MLRRIQVQVKRNFLSLASPEWLLCGEHEYDDNEDGMKLVLDAYRRLNSSHRLPKEEYRIARAIQNFEVLDIPLHAKVCSSASHWPIEGLISLISHGYTLEHNSHKVKVTERYESLCISFGNRSITRGSDTVAEWEDEGDNTSAGYARWDTSKFKENVDAWALWLYSDGQVPV